MEELEYNLLFRWFVGLNMDDPVWHPTTFTKNRDRLVAGEVAATFFDTIGRQARAAGLLSDEHFTVDGTQLEVWASLKSFRPRTGPQGPPPDDPRNLTVDFHGERRRNDTHQSTTDPQARLYRKGSGREATLAYLGHVLLDNWHGLVANVCVTAATGTAERDAAAWMLAASAPPGSRSAPMAHKAERGVDLDTGAIVSVTVQDASDSDPSAPSRAAWSAIRGTEAVATGRPPRRRAEPDRVDPSRRPVKATGHVVWRLQESRIVRRQSAVSLARCRPFRRAEEVVLTERRRPIAVAGLVVAAPEPGPLPAPRWRPVAVTGNRPLWIDRRDFGDATSEAIGTGLTGEGMAIGFRSCGERMPSTTTT